MASYFQYGSIVVFLKARDFYKTLNQIKLKKKRKRKKIYNSASSNLPFPATQIHLPFILLRYILQLRKFLVMLLGNIISNNLR